MTTRRQFLTTTALTAIAPELLVQAATSQTPAIPASTVSKDEIFADFESGTFDGWTLSGNCWTKEPHDATTIPGITGFQGKRFLCTFHPKLRTNATGKAISREFTMEKPFINFLIGGGNYPGETCLNLVVDGKVVRTETGNGSSELVQKSWDVSQLVGKKAQFEVVDASKSPDRGYVMVDGITFCPSHKSNILLETGRLPFQKQVIEMAEGWRTKYGIPGVWCAYIISGKVVACVATGINNLRVGTPASIDDHLGIGSVSKVISGSMIALFVADGTIKYDTTLGDVFRDLATKHPNSPVLSASLRQLISHTAGLPKSFATQPKDKDGKSYRLTILEKCIQLGDRIMPGGPSGYSNLGIQLAVAMVERLTSSNYEAWLMGPIGQRIGLSNPKILDTEKLASTDVVPYFIKDGLASPGVRPDAAYLKFQPSGCCSVTLPDLCSFLEFTMKNTAGLPASVYSEMTHFVRSGQIDHGNTSAGWAGNSELFLAHTGNTGRGEYCGVEVSPKQQRGFVVYINGVLDKPDNEWLHPIFLDIRRASFYR